MRNYLYYPVVLCDGSSSTVFSSSPDMVGFWFMTEGVSWREYPDLGKPINHTPMAGHHLVKIGRGYRSVDAAAKTARAMRDRYYAKHPVYCPNA